MTKIIVNLADRSITDADNAVLADWPGIEDDAEESVIAYAEAHGTPVLAFVSAAREVQAVTKRSADPGVSESSLLLPVRTRKAGDLSPASVSEPRAISSLALVLLAGLAEAHPDQDDDRASDG